MGVINSKTSFLKKDYSDTQPSTSGIRLVVVHNNHLLQPNIEQATIEDPQPTDINQ